MKQASTATAGAGAGVLLAYAALTCAALFWAGNFVTGRALRDAVDPVALNFYRWLVAAMLVLPLGLRDMMLHRDALLRRWPVFIGLALTGICGYQTLVYLAVRHTEAISAVLVLQFAPVAITLGARLFHGDPITPLRGIGMLVAALGAFVLIGRGDPTVVLRLDLNVGDIAMLAAVVLWAIYSLLLRWRPSGVPQMAQLGATVAVGLSLLLPAWVLTGGAAAGLPLEPGVLGGVLYIGVFASFFAFLFWNTGVDTVGPGRASVFMYLMPLFGAVLGYVLLGEDIESFHLLGAVLVFGGIAIMNRG